MAFPRLIENTIGWQSKDTFAYQTRSDAELAKRGDSKGKYCILDAFFPNTSTEEETISIVGWKRVQWKANFE